MKLLTDVLSSPDKWTRGSLIHGDVNPDTGEIYSYTSVCLTGAIYVLLGKVNWSSKDIITQVKFSQYARIMQDVIKEVTLDSASPSLLSGLEIVYFNDDMSRTFDEVYAVAKETDRRMQLIQES